MPHAAPDRATHLSFGSKFTIANQTDVELARLTQPLWRANDYDRMLLKAATVPCTALIGLICAEVFIPERNSKIETQVTLESS
jgi:hypothetical protein